jgi:uncharacterized protein
MAESDLSTLLRELRPTLHRGTYAFCVCPGDRPPTNVPAVMTFRETEGCTLIVEAEAAAAHGLQCLFQAAWITLGVNSDLHAVGLLAAVTRALADAAIPSNVVSAMYHDHLFVPVEQGAEAVRVLEALCSAARQNGLE